jgi:hypothetical protein
MAAPQVPLPELDPASLTLDQIKQLMIENKILKEILAKTGIGTT